MLCEGPQAGVTCQETYHSGSTSVIIDILSIRVIDEVAPEKLEDTLYLLGLLNVVVDNPTRRRFSCKESGIRVNM